MLPHTLPTLQITSFTNHILNKNQWGTKLIPLDLFDLTTVCPINDNRPFSRRKKESNILPSIDIIKNKEVHGINILINNWNKSNAAVPSYTRTASYDLMLKKLNTTQPQITCFYTSCREELPSHRMQRSVETHHPSGSQKTISLTTVQRYHITKSCCVTK